MFFAEPLAAPVHRAPDDDGEDKVDRVLHRADERLAEEGHHGHHHTLAQQHGDEVALFVKIRDAEGKVHEGRRGERQHRQHEQGRNVEPADPLLSFFQLLRSVSERQPWSDIPEP